MAGDSERARLFSRRAILLGGAQSLTYKDPNGYLQSLSSDPEATREAVLMLASMFVASLVAVLVVAALVLLLIKVFGIGV